MKISAVLITMLVCTLSALAGDGGRAVRAARIQYPPVIDGILDEDVWKQATQADDFIQLDPLEGEKASEATQIRVLFDDEALYFGCMFFDSSPELIVARLTRRDDEIESDWGSIRIDSYHDHQTAYEFTFNAAGVKTDILQYDDASREDPSWDPVWEVETRILADGWSAEVKIPFSVLRYRGSEAESEENEWGINFIRHISRKQERDYWLFTPKRESGFVSRFGHLTGLDDLPTPRQLELLPFGLAQYESEPERPGQAGKEELSGTAGIDVKYSVTSNFVLDATINPDFGQVEADPAVLNLSTFETFFPEKRPFFIEGTQIIRFSTFGDSFGPGMFYSRRIGRALSSDEVSLPDGGRIVSAPKNVSILGAAKFSGKTRGGLSLGVLQAFTGKESATIMDSTGKESEQLLEPFTHYNVVRLRQDVLQNSNVGMIVTTVARETESPAVTAGGDWNLRFDSNTYQVNGFLAFSRTTNSAAERVNGSAGKLSVSKIAAEHWLWSVGADYTSRKYNINDVGFFFRPNDYGGTFSLTYKEDRPSLFYRNYSVNLFLHERRNFDNVSIFRESNLSGGLLFANYWSANAQFSMDTGEFDDRETRGNGNYEKPSYASVRVGLESDIRENVIFEAEQQYGWDTKQRRVVGTGVGVAVRPLTWMQWSIEGGYERVSNFEAWVDNVTLTSGSTASIFADRTTEQVDMTLRGTVTFTRDLTLQVYSQILLAKGTYAGFRQLVGTSGFEPFAYSGNPDFNEQWLNLNVVFRWEYLPGSTMFLVWSRAGNHEDMAFNSSFGENFSSALRAPAGDVFLLKVSYWLSI